MMSASTEAAVARINRLLMEVMAKDAPPRPVRADESLPDAGVSSLDMVNLMLAIEADFDIFIPSEDVNPSNFKSIEAIAVMVGRLNGAVGQLAHSG